MCILVKTGYMQIPKLSLVHISTKDNFPSDSNLASEMLQRYFPTFLGWWDCTVFLTTRGKSSDFPGAKFRSGVKLCQHYLYTIL